MEKFVRKLIPKKSTLPITYTGKKLSSQFNIKGNTNFEHRYDLIYHVNCYIHKHSKTVTSMKLHAAYTNAFKNTVVEIKSRT